MWVPSRHELILDFTDDFSGWLISSTRIFLEFAARKFWTECILESEEKELFSKDEIIYRSCSSGLEKRDGEGCYYKKFNDVSCNCTDCK